MVVIRQQTLLYKMAGKLLSLVWQQDEKPSAHPHLSLRLKFQFCCLRPQNRFKPSNLVSQNVLFILVFVLKLFSIILHFDKQLDFYTSQQVRFYNQKMNREQQSPDSLGDDPFEVKNGQVNMLLDYRNYQHSGLQSPPRTIDPGDQGDLSSDPSSVISKFISIINGNQEDQADQTINISFNSIPQENPTVSVHQGESHLQSLTNSTPPNPRQNKGRANNSNNADKKMITILNGVLTSQQKKALKTLLDTLQSKQKNIEVDIIQSSRCKFIQTLVILLHLFGIQVVLQRFSDFKVKLGLFVQKIQMQPHSETNDYLLKLPRPYTEAFELFLEGSIEKAMDILYARDKFKQRKHKQEGIQKVLKLEKYLADLAH